MKYYGIKLFGFSFLEKVIFSESGQVLNMLSGDSQHTAYKTESKEEALEIVKKLQANSFSCEIVNLNVKGKMTKEEREIEEMFTLLKAGVFE